MKIANLRIKLTLLLALAVAAFPLATTSFAKNWHHDRGRHLGWERGRRERWNHWDNRPHYRPRRVVRYVPRVHYRRRVVRYAPVRWRRPVAWGAYQRGRYLGQYRARRRVIYLEQLRRGRLRNYRALQYQRRLRVIRATQLRRGRLRNLRALQYQRRRARWTHTRYYRRHRHY